MTAKTSAKNIKATATYHHGDLRSALLVAAESVLAEKGLSGFTLRECARRACVSHSAPAHHFKDVTGLLTVMATDAFRRLNVEMLQRKNDVNDEPNAVLQAIGEGYIAFAVNNPQHFALMFRDHLLDRNNEALIAESRHAFSILVSAIASFHDGEDPMLKPESTVDVLLAWSIVHGFSQLYLDGQFEPNCKADSKEANLTVMASQMMKRMLDLFANKE